MLAGLLFFNSRGWSVRLLGNTAKQRHAFNRGMTLIYIR
jgi:hypothetical protein